MNGGSEKSDAPDDPLDRLDAATRKLAPGSRPYVEQEDEVSEVTANIRGVHARGIPRLGMLLISVAISALILAGAIRLIWH